MIGHTDEDHLDTLYRRYGPSIHRRVRSLLRDPEEALDVTHDTFLAYMRKPSLRGVASPFTVLYQIATYQAVDRLRRRRRSRWSGALGLLDILEDEPPVPSVWAASDGGGISRIEALQDLAVITEGETPQALTAAVLYFVEGYTMDEVAQALDLSRRTVSDLLRKFAERARKRSARFNPRYSS